MIAKGNYQKLLINYEVSIFVNIWLIRCVFYWKRNKNQEFLQKCIEISQNKLSFLRFFKNYYILILMNNQKKLVEALKIFMETIAPVLGEDHSALNQWKYLSGILSQQHIDPAQLDFYLLMANKSSNSATNSGISSNSTGQKTTFQASKSPSQKFGITRFPVSEVQSPPRLKATYSGDSQRKQLFGNMINFQTNMIKNQQKLENFNKRQPNTSIQLNTSSNTSFTGSKKFV